MGTLEIRRRWGTADITGTYASNHNAERIMRAAASGGDLQGLERQMGGEAFSEAMRLLVSRGQVTAAGGQSLSSEKVSLLSRRRL